MTDTDRIQTIRSILDGFAYPQRGADGSIKYVTITDHEYLGNGFFTDLFNALNA